MNHPAKYSDIMLPVFAKQLQGYLKVLDPMAGTGKLAQIYLHGYHGQIYCNEIEPDWQKSDHPEEVIWSFTDAEHLPYRDGSFDAICTSPTYGNRLADHWNRKDTSKRFSYTFNLGKELHPENTGKMHWGKSYREKHILIWKECLRVLRDNGKFIVNVSDHIRNYQLIPVVQWHKDTLLSLGLTLKEEYPISTPRLRYGSNHKARVGVEWILVFQKGEKQ
jgi:SAM-dependent methyltransferase